MSELNEPTIRYDFPPKSVSTDIEDRALARADLIEAEPQRRVAETCAILREAASAIHDLREQVRDEHTSNILNLRDATVKLDALRAERDALRAERDRYLRVLREFGVFFNPDDEEWEQPERDAPRKVVEAVERFGVARRRHIDGEGTWDERDRAEANLIAALLSPERSSEGK